MIDTFFRKPYQKLLIDPLLPSLSKWNFSPTSCTWGALLSGILTFPALAWGYPLPALFLLFFSGYLDTLDGSIARYQGKSSNSGAMLDIISDRTVESSVIMGLYAIDPLSRGWLCLFMLASVLLCVTTFLVAGIFVQQESEKSFYYSPGLMERSEAFIFFGLMIAFPFAFTPLAILFSILVAWTAVKRLYEFSR